MNKEVPKNNSDDLTEEIPVSPKEHEKLEEAYEDTINGENEEEIEEPDPESIGVADDVERGPDGRKIKSESEVEYLELKRDYKEKKRAYDAAFAKDVKNRSSFKKTFGLGRKKLTEETQKLYDELLKAEKAYYQSFVETKKDKVETYLNRNLRREDDEKRSVVPALIKRHITNPGQERYDAQEREMSERTRAILDGIKKHRGKIALTLIGSSVVFTGGASITAIAAAFGGGIAANKIGKWELGRLKESREQKVNDLDRLLESGGEDPLGDLKNEYFQDLRNIDSQEVRAKVATVLVAAAAGGGTRVALEAQAPGDADNFVAEKASELWDAAKEKMSSFADATQELPGSYDEVLEQVGEAETPETTLADATEKMDNMNDVHEAHEQARESLEAQAVEQELEADAELREQAQEKVDNMRAVQEAQAQASEVMEAGAVPDDVTASVDQQILEESALNQELLDQARQLADLNGIEVDGPINIEMDGDTITKVEGHDIPEYTVKDGVITELSGNQVPEELTSVTDQQSESLSETADISAEISQEDLISEALAIAERMEIQVDSIPDYELGENGEIVSVEGNHVLDQYRTPGFGEGIIEDATTDSVESVDAVLEKYEIVRGDTLSEIAEANDVSIKELMEANPEITDPHAIVEGQEIIIPEATGSPVYDEGVGLGGPGSEGYDPGVSTEATVESVEANEGIAEAQSANPETPVADAQVAASETASPEAANVAENVEAGAAGQVAEVPDYSGAEAVSGATDTTEPSPAEAQDTGDETAETPDTEAATQPEAFSNTPREATFLEVGEKQKMMEEKVLGLSEDTSFWSWKQDVLVEADVEMGYEPVYTPELLERTVQIGNGTTAVQLYEEVVKDMVLAYQEGQIHLPAQWTYVLDGIEDNLSPGGNDILESVKNMTERNANNLMETTAADLRFLNSLSGEQLKELGINSASLNGAIEGSEVQTGQIIKLMMQNMAERINGAGTTT